MTNFKTTNGAVNGNNGAWACPACSAVNAISDRSLFSQEVICGCGRNFDLQQWDAQESISCLEIKDQTPHAAGWFPVPTIDENAMRLMIAKGHTFRRTTRTLSFQEVA